MPAVAAAVPEMVPVPLEGLIGDAPLPFPLFLPTGNGRLVLYRDAQTSFGPEQLSRLREEGVSALFIHPADRRPYSRRIEGALDKILRDKSVPLERRGLVLYGVAVEVANDLLEARPDQESLRRAESIFAATSSLVLREPLGFRALRQSITASPLLAQHSLNVGLLALGLARHVLGAEPRTLVRAGLAGLLHDAGRIGHLDLLHEDDPEHTERGHAELVRLGLPREVCEAALHHHERRDGRGFPSGLAGERIPELARIVAIVNLFDRIYSEGQRQEPRLSTYAALHHLAREHAGAYDERLAVFLVQLFR